ncbi:hypothetical protein RHOSPDRAFT_30783 [Rhodotorula sp. JG-1b]|nr:hypothetical protein RHOSPDRAFT_30783 [Rhodotorula sp. JG-1b]
MWADALSDPQERQAFHSVLAEYFQRPYPTSSSSSRPEASSTPPLAASGEPALPARRTVAPVPAPASRTSTSRPQPPTPTSPPRERPTTGPRKPAGLEPQQKTAGGFDASSGSALTKSLFASKGPLNKAELEKQKALSPLYVPVAKQALKSFAPPPKRVGIEPGGAATTEGTGPSAPIARSAPGASVRTVEAVYDYEGSSIDELPIAEGERLTVIETVSSDWLKCRNSVGSEGLVPTSYVR